MKTQSTPVKYVVALQLCVGKEAPIPVLPAIPCYRHILIGEPTTKRKAAALRNKLCNLNHGYSFAVVPEGFGRV